MKEIFEKLRFLYNEELYSNVMVLGDLLVSICENNRNSADFDPFVLLSTYVYYGRSAYFCGIYKKAIQMLTMAIQYRKSLNKLKDVVSRVENSENKFLTDSEIKYSLYLVYDRLYMWDEALNAVKSIKVRSPKVNMALAKMYNQKNMERCAVTHYKEVIKSCPLALEAAENLLKLGVTGVEVHSLLSFGYHPTIDWLNCWMKAKANDYNGEYVDAIKGYRKLLWGGSLRNNSLIMLGLAESLLHQGNVMEAKMTLMKLLEDDPCCNRSYSIMSTICMATDDIECLKKVIPISSNYHDYNDSNVWMSLATIMYMKSITKSAAYFAQKACILDPRNIEALILKGKMLFDMKNYPNALAHFREASMVDQRRFEPQKGIVECHLAMNNFRDAMNEAESCCNIEKNSARSLVLFATVLQKDPVNKGRAKEYFEKALEADETHLPAVYSLVSLCQEAESWEYAKNLVKKHLQKAPDSKLLQLMADLMMQTNDFEEAFDYYNKALRVDPKNYQALMGLKSIENAAKPKLEVESDASDTSMNTTHGPLHPTEARAPPQRRDSVDDENLRFDYDQENEDQNMSDSDF